MTELRSVFEVVAELSARRGDLANLLDPVALSVTVDADVDADDPLSLTRAVTVIEPVVHPDLEALLQASSATRRGRFSWAFGLGEDCDPTALRVAIDHVVPGLVVAKSNACNTRGPVNVRERMGWNCAWAMRRLLQTTAAGSVMTQDRWNRLCQVDLTGRAERAAGVVTVSTDGRVLWLSVRTHFLAVPEGLPEIPLNLRPAGRQAVEPRHQVTSEVIRVVDWARSVGIEVVTDERYARLVELAARSVSVWPSQGRPAEASCAVGRLVPASVRQALSVGQVPAGVTAELGGVDAATVASELTGEHARAVSPHVADVAAMAGAVAVADGNLKDYQREIVGVHLATGLGFVNALPTGMGKTITTLAAFRAKARRDGAWRGLVVVEANVRAQWAEQARQWFPEARVQVVSARSDADALAATLAGAGSRPVLVICSYALAADAAEAVQATVVDDGGQFRLFADCGEPATAGSDLGRVLVGTHWDDLVADEAIGLRNTGTKLAGALWRLRSVSEVAVALTGTPITKGLDDLGRLIAWSRGDADLFRGARLERSFDLSEDDQLAAYLRAIGPLVQRRDKSELDGEIPQLAPSVIRLDPTPAEKHLATAARVELKRVYDELVSHMELAEAARTGEDAQALSTARAALVAARGAWLGGTQLARMAASDPEALIGSKSAGAALLAAQGLVDSACADGGTKRQWCVSYCAAKVADGDQVLVFTEFASVARRLIAELRDAGVAVGAVLGGGGAARDRDIAAFRSGELSVLVSTSAGERGLNLQAANAIVHYDLPWTPDGVVQRTGRVQRIGAGSAPVSVVFPIMSGTVEERVASMVVARAVTSLRALDTARGVDARDSELGRALGELAGSVNVDEVGGGHARMLAITRELLG